MYIPLHKPYLDEEEKEIVSETIDSGWLSSEGDRVEEFESRVKDFLGLEYGLATDSGTAALHSALKAVGVEPGDEVLVPGFTYGATALAVRQIGARPVPVDIERETFGIDPEKLEDKIEESTAAVIVAHLFGRPAQIERIVEIAGEEKVPVVEDVAQAFGAEYQGSKLGGFGDAAAFSFSWNKIPTTGKGGFVATDDPEVYNSIESFVCEAREDRKFEAEEGFNYRMDNIRASIGVSQMEKYSEAVKQNRRVVERYSSFLDDLDGLEVFRTSEGVSTWVFYILTEDRSALVERLEGEGVGYRKFYRPVRKLDFIEDDYETSVSDKVASEGLILPTYPGLERDTQEKVLEIIRKEIG